MFVGLLKGDGKVAAAWVETSSTQRRQECRRCREESLRHGRGLPHSDPLGRFLTGRSARAIAGEGTRRAVAIRSKVHFRQRRVRTAVLLVQSRGYRPGTPEFDADRRSRMSGSIRTRFTSIPYQVMAIPGQSRTVEIRVRNLRSKAIDIEAVLVLPEGWRAVPSKTRLHVAAGETGKTAVSV